MQILQRWRNLLILNNTVTQSARLGVVATHLASLHSTNAFFEQRKSNSGATRDKIPSKAKIKYVIRKYRSDMKKAVNRTLYRWKFSTSGPEIVEDYEDQLNKKSRLKPSHHSKRTAKKKLKRNHRRDTYDDDDYDPTKEFYYTFGNAYYWNFKFRERSEWTGTSHWSRTESQSFTLGTYADRESLGLPTTGPLKIKDVKGCLSLLCLEMAS